MAIDNLLKRLQTLFNEIAVLRKKDPEQALLIFASAFQEFNPYLDLLTLQQARLNAGTAHVIFTPKNTP